MAVFVTFGVQPHVYYYTRRERDVEGLATREYSIRIPEKA
jgi:hypothetical protein